MCRFKPGAQLFSLIIIQRYFDRLTVGIFKWFNVKTDLLNIEHLGFKHKE